MSLLNRLFGAGKKPDHESAVLEKLAVQFDQAQAKYLKLLIDGLQDPNVEVRRDYARLIADTVVPALDDDPNPETRALSLKTLNVLTAELRPPKNERELWELNNAAFYAVLRLQSAGTKGLNL